MHPLCFWSHDGGLIHSRSPVRKLEDLRGMKLRFPTRQAGEGCARSVPRPSACRCRRCRRR
ncbi:hypothetical protein [Teichococcus aestuarii]|uniref:hypothetical protein n=1 Tax=Teichococcus aestuarii TaxID=568898 RepID=UPI00361342FD